MIQDCDRELVRRLVVLFGGNGLSTDAQAEIACDMVAKFRLREIEKTHLPSWFPSVPPYDPDPRQ